LIAAPAGAKVLVADSLVALVREQLQHDPFSGTIFIFRSKREHSGDPDQPFQIAASNIATTKLTPAKSRARRARA